MLKRNLKKRWRKLLVKLKLKWLLGVLSGGIFLTYVWSINSTLDLLIHNQQNLIDEVGSKVQVMKNLELNQKEDLKKFGMSLNEIRSFLLLPSEDFSFENKNQDGNSDATEEENLARAFLLYFDQLSTQKEFEKFSKHYQELFEQLISSADWQEIFQSQQIKGQVVSENRMVIFRVMDAQDRYLVQFEIVPQEKNIFINEFFRRTTVPYETEQDIKQELTAFLERKIEYLKDYVWRKENKKVELQNLFLTPGLAELLNQKQFSTNFNFAERSDWFEIEIVNKSQEKVASVYLEKIRLEWGLKNLEEENPQWYEDNNQLLADLQNELSEISELTQQEKQILKKKEEIIAILSQAAFQDNLKEKGFLIDLNPQDEGDRWAFLLQDAEGNLLQKIVLEKGSGELKITQPDGTAGQRLSDILQSVKKKL